ncbi:UNVERIFIED_CONTAM: hypothetical protein HDU68_010886 [Siphonaria sp. JEL0065]|nr:hypothetical protein HDU68_010886 [Siphonaria sp. JEL0065]
MLATTEEIQAVVSEVHVKTMSFKDLAHGDLPDEDIEDADYTEDHDNDHQMDEEMHEDGESSEDGDDNEQEIDEDIDAEEVNDLNMEVAHMQKGKVLRSGFKATGNYRDVTIHDMIATEDDEDEEYQEGHDEEDDEDEDSEDDEDAEEEEEEVDEEEVKAMIVNATHLPSKDATVLRDGKEIPAAESEVDLVARMQQLMQQ